MRTDRHRFFSPVNLTIPPMKEQKPQFWTSRPQKKQPYGQVVELDYVSIDRISLHGSFGYIAFDINGSDDSATMEPVAAYTLEEAGPIVTQGDEYTEVLGSADGCVVAPKAYMKEKNPMYLYSNTYGDVTELPEKSLQDPQRE